MRAKRGGTDQRYFQAVICGVGSRSDHACLVTDMTHESARIRLDPDDRLNERFPLPERFSLSFCGALPRLCEVVWRSDGELGVKFRRMEEFEDVPGSQATWEHFNVDISVS
jgi:hypothetical protein